MKITLSKDKISGLMCLLKKERGKTVPQQLELKLNLYLFDNMQKGCFLHLFAFHLKQPFFKRLL